MHIHLLFSQLNIMLSRALPKSLINPMRRNKAKKTRNHPANGNLLLTFGPRFIVVEKICSIWLSGIANIGMHSSLLVASASSASHMFLYVMSPKHTGS